MTLSSISKFIYSLGFNKVNFDVQAVIEATKLKNSQDQTPKIIATSKTAKGWSLVYVLPPGITLKEFEDRRKYFEAYTNSKVEFEQSGRRLILNTYKVNFPNKIPFAFERNKMLAPLPLGLTLDGDPLVVDLSKLPHILVGGMTGYGKTTALIGFTVALLLSEVEVSVIDRKRMDFPSFAPWVELALKEDETEKLLEKAVRDMDKRIDTLQAAGVQKFQKYKGKDMRYKVIIIDELTVIENKNSHKYIDELVHLGRAAGISLILATQRPSAKVWDGFTEARAMLGGRLCFYVSDSTDSQIILGKGNSKGAELPQIPGRAVFNNDNNIIIQSMYIDSEKAIQILNKSVPRRNKDEQQIVRIPT